MMRTEFSQKTKVAAFQRAHGQCETCTAVIRPGNGPIYDHRNPCELGGDNSIENCQVLCRGCDKAKTRTDQKNIGHARRVHAKHIGARTKRSRPFACGKNSKWKKKISGEVVQR